MSVARSEVEYEAFQQAVEDRHVIIVSERAYDDMMEACKREEAPQQGLVDAYRLYRERVVSSAR